MVFFMITIAARSIQSLAQFYSSAVLQRNFLLEFCSDPTNQQPSSDPATVSSTDSLFSFINNRHSRSSHRRFPQSSLFPSSVPLPDRTTTMSDPSSPANHTQQGGASQYSFANDDYIQNAHRFPAWMALTVFSTVCVAALNARRDIFDAEDTWPNVVACLSLIMGFGAVVCYLMFRPVFVGQLPEIIVVRKNELVWALLLDLW
jgi:hypothetical protein